MHWCRSLHWIWSVMGFQYRDPLCQSKAKEIHCLLRFYGFAFLLSWGDVIYRSFFMIVLITYILHCFCNHGDMLIPFRLTFILTSFALLVPCVETCLLNREALWNKRKGIKNLIIEAHWKMYNVTRKHNCMQLLKSRTIWLKVWMKVCYNYRWVHFTHTRNKNMRTWDNPLLSSVTYKRAFRITSYCIRVFQGQSHWNEQFLTEPLKSME